jgi:hypothetical protein
MEIEVGRACGMHRTYENCIQIFFIGKPEGKIPFGRRKHRLKDNIKMALREWLGRLWTAFIWLRTGASSWLF